jgi:O-antigen ligase
MTTGTIDRNRPLISAHAALFAAAVLVPAPLVTGLLIPYRFYYGVILAGLVLVATLGARLISPERLRWLCIVWIPFIACTLLSVAVSENPSRSLLSFGSFLIRGVAVAAILHAALNEAGVRAMSRIMVALAFVAGVNGFVELIAGFNIPFARQYAHMDPAFLSLMEARGGVVGTIGHPLPFGTLLAIFVPIAIALPIPRRFRVILTVGLVLGIIASLSRASLLAGALGTSFMAGVATSGSLKRRLGAAVVPLISAAVIWTVVGSLPFGKHLVADTSTEHHRYGAFLMAGKVLHDHPLLGFGQGLFEENYERYRPPEMSPLITSPDNQYLRRLMETGILGLAALLWALGAYALRMVATLRKNAPRERHTLLAGLAGGLLTGCAAFFFFDGYIWLSTQLAFFSVAGAATALCSTAEN